MPKVLDRGTGGEIPSSRVEILPNGPVDAPQDDNRARQDRDFVKLYRRFIQQISDLGLENPSALRVLLFLIRHMDGMNAISVTQTLIAEMVGYSRQTVSAAIKYLQDNGWILIGKIGKSNVYIINSEVVWTSYADQKAYSKFQGSIMLSSKDNWEISKSQADKGKVKYICKPIIQEMAADEFPAEQMSIDDFPELLP